jgi:hypothetical protein
MHPKKLLGLVSVAVSVSALLAACGGGGGGGAKNSGDGLPELITASAIVDVNGDGKADLIISSQGNGYSAPIVLINDGNGSAFTLKTSAIPSQYLGANGAAVDIQSGDFNNDGKVDLLVSTVDVGSSSFYSASQLQLFLGNGDGTFTDATANISNGKTTGGWVDHILVADFDGDGHLDFAVSDGSLGMLYLNDGSGRFHPATININKYGTVYSQGQLGYRNVIAGDINNDGKQDLFFPDCTCSFINTSTSGVLSFTQVSSPSGNGMANGALVDIDGDGFLDLVASSNISGSPTLTVPVIAAQGNGSGNFTLNNSLLTNQPGLVHGRQFLAADFNGDGKKDVLILDHGYDASPWPGARNWLLINNGAGKLADVTATSLDLLHGYTHQGSIGDLNGDGKLDIVLNNSFQTFSGFSADHEPRFWLNDGNGKFTSYSPTIH